MRDYSKLNSEIKFLIIFFIVFMSINFFFEKTKSEHDVIPISKSWTVNINEELYENVDLSKFKFKFASKGDVLKLSSVLPDTFPDNPLLCVYLIHSDIKVDIAGKTVYESGRERYEEGKLVGYGYHFITLTPEMTGQTLIITLRVSENSAFSSLEVPEINNSAYFIRDFSIKNRLILCILIFSIAFGLILLIVTVVYITKTQIFIKLFCISMFFICIGCWSFCSHDLIILFTYNPLVKAYLEFISLYMAPFFVLGYFGYEALLGSGKLRKYAYLTIMSTQAAFILIAIVLLILNIVHFPAFLIVCHVLMVIITTYIFSIFIYDIYKKQLTISPTLLFGFSIMAIYFLVDLIRFNVQKYLDITVDDHYISKIYIGMFIFSFSLIIDFCSGIITSLYKSAESATLEKMAYTDCLTGLSNRRKFEEVMDEIDQSQSPYVVIVFDLNGLKKVNDTLGHDEGDRYIKEFGQALNRTFQNYGIAGRTGGDEFQVIIRNAENLDIDQLISKLHEQINRVNEQNHNWHMSTAYGFCFSYEAGVASVRCATKVADERMYQKKIEMKVSNALC